MIVNCIDCGKEKEDDGLARCQDCERKADVVE